VIVCLNGRFLPEHRAHISISDHGFLYGDGVYETLRVEQGQPQFLNEHLKRLAHARRRLQLRSSWSDTQLRAFIAKTIDFNKLRSAAVRLTLTRGPGPHGFDPHGCFTPTLLITARPFSGYPERLRRRGLTLAVVQTRRNNRDSTPPGVKSISCLNGVLAKMESKSMKADEALLLTHDGKVAEGSVSNIFMVKKGVLSTPRLDGNQLPGVTRAQVCRLARRLKIPLRERALKLADLFAADEIFLTNALMGVMPVGTLLSPLKRRTFRVGQITELLMRLFNPPVGLIADPADF